MKQIFKLKLKIKLKLKNTIINKSIAIYETVIEPFAPSKRSKSFLQSFGDFEAEGFSGSE